VVGALRHKGCPSAPAGATVSVIGRDATAVSDADGRFALTLPPGAYSLVIGGKGLVSDQRVDDVNVVLGQTRDLGVVEVWPEERPAGCVNPVPAPTPTAVVAVAPGTPTVDLPGSGVAPAAVGAEQIWTRGGAGSAPGQFGLQGNPAHDDEDALGPPTFAIGPQGSLWVLDALNGRVQRFDARGHPASSFPIGRRGDEPPLEADLAVADDGHLFLFTQGDCLTLTEHDATGRRVVTGALPPSFKGVDLLFLGRMRPLFLMQNGQAVRADLGWGGIRADGPLPGLPAGDLYVHADRIDRWRVNVLFSGLDGRVRRTVQLHSRVPVAGVRLVGVDRRGEIILALDRTEGGEEGTPRAEVLLLAVDQHGHLAGTARAPPGGRRFEFREFALAADGTVVQMQSDVGEVRFVRWTLRPPPREAIAGEGLVRGRVVEGGRGVAAATVTIGKLHRTVPVASDGSFEVRLPAGTWAVSVRRPPPGPGLEAPAVDLKVAVAAGATVDLGAITLPRQRPPAPPTSTAPPTDRSTPATMGMP
jgi:hypothetical protein